MNTVIIYDSLYGNTEEVARVLAGTLQQYGKVCLHTIETASTSEISHADLLIFGCPTQHHHATARTVDLLDQLPRPILREKAVAVFDTRYRLPKLMSGSAGADIASQIERLCGGLLVPVTSFFVADHIGPLEEHQLDHAAEWAEELATACSRRRLVGSEAPQRCEPRETGSLIVDLLTWSSLDQDRSAVIDQ